MNLEEQIDSIYDQLYQLDGQYTLKNKDIIFDLVQKAIQTKDKELEFEARLEYLSQLVFLNFYDEAIAYFPWFLNYKKNNPLGYYHYHHLVWSFKWIIIRVASYGKIPLAQINSLFQQFENEVKEYGAGDKVIEYFSSIVQLGIGNLEAAEEKYKKYRKLRKTSDLDDCYACQINNMLDLHMAKRDYKKVISEAKDLVSEKYSCKSVPKTTYPKVTFAHLMLGNTLKAEEFYQLSVKKLNLDEPQITNVYYLLFFLAKKNELLKVKKLLDKQLDYVLKSNSDLDKFKFYLGCYLVFKNAVLHKNKKIKLKQHDGLNCAYDEKGYDCLELEAWFKEKTISHSDFLDKRNNNTYYTDYYTFLDSHF
ncbi:hypothetical protein FLAVO9AF_30051 [Flavobacterium sp. 9AF]|uniref:hypothetical protein n=1 Tax=Flavobacterium sp. 9AF TaxID=2653142 RepID=UPI0012F473C6|nr:hypothetical protein [Flavobacterium sp. 9AF]VXB84753.1 hypothetical protein FLAVO9AF_30051 [Flavobacterium sp. 9AF]